MVWRGWGILVVLAPVFWVIVVLVAALAAGLQDPDPIRSAALLYRIGAAGFLLAAITLWIVERSRARVAPGVDHFAFIPVKYWNVLILLCAIGFFVASFVPAALEAVAAS